MTPLLRQLPRRVTQFCREGFRPLDTRVWEWAIMRVLFAVVVWDDLQSPDLFTLTVRDPEHANGIARFVPLDWISAEGVREPYLAVCAMALLAYVALGRFRPVLALSTTVALAGHVILRTMQNSQGSIHHSHQIIGLVLLAQCAVAWWLWICGLRRPDLNRVSPPASGSDASWLQYYSLGVVVASYVTAGVAKLANSKGLWVWNSPYISFDLIKSERQAFYKELDPAYTDVSLAQWVLDHPWISRLAFGGAFWLELLALVALKNRTWAFWTGLALISLHLGIWMLMHLEFDANLWCLLIFAVNLPWWIMHRLRRAGAGGV